MMRWVESPHLEVSEEVLAAAGGNKMVAEVLASRGIFDATSARAFLDPENYHSSPPEEMPGMVAAVNIIEKTIREGLKIGIWGDFDVDGQTATTLLVSSLKMLGADVVFHIPVRAEESHGVNIPNLARLLDDDVKLVVTCDTGISAHDAVLYARDRAVKFVITDHHDLPAKLPMADAIINSKLMPKKHPLAALPGVGVAFKLVEALFFNQGRSNELAQFLDLVALGIVADIAYLTGESRYLLQRGLERLKISQRLGLQILMENAEISQEFVSEEEISFSIAPRLNSLGRLGDANVIVDFFTSDQESKVRVLANQLEGLNAQRKLLSSQVYQAAESQLERNPSLQKNSALVLASKNWPAGVVGIVANRLVEKYHKPTILLTIGEDGIARGSARSIPGCDISKSIAACSDLLEGYGGHPMAAGLSIKTNQIDAFNRRLSEEVNHQLGVVDFEPELVFDIFVELENVSLSLAEQVEPLAPFGPGNPALVFVTQNLKLISHSVLGRSGEHLRLIVEDAGGEQKQVVWWQGADRELPGGFFDLAFAVRKNYFRGEVQLQVELLDFKNVVPEETPPALPEIELVDCRRLTNPKQHLAKLLAESPSVVIWADGPDHQELAGSAQHKLFPGELLVIWHSPPSVSLIREAIEYVDPKKVCFYGIDPKLDEFEPFIMRLASLCKFVISQKDGATNLDELASAMTHTKAVVRLGLEWLENTRKISILRMDEKSILISKAQEEKVDGTAVKISLEQINPLLREAKSFRKYLAESTLDQLNDVISNKDGFNNDEIIW